jgi:hypothetical protein
VVQCALIAQRYSPYPKNYYQRKKSRGTGKAIIALARKVLEIIYRTLKNQWVFEDSPTLYWRRKPRRETEHRRLRLRYAQPGFAPTPAAHRLLGRGKPKPEAMNLGVDKTSYEYMND